MLKPIVIPSPDRKHKAVLNSVSEVQSGPSYYTLSITGFPVSFENRIFGDVCLWSPESRFLTVQEWKELDESEGPKSCLLLIIDLLASRECVVASLDGAQGNILPEGYIGESLMYRVVYSGQFGMTKSYESKFQYLTGWQVLK